MKNFMALFAVAALVMVGAAGCQSKQKCLEKEGFKSCDDLRSAMAKAVGNDEAYRFHTIAKKCGCDETQK